jgi:2-polyprenyl-3-methyl-5-hydroxy-6-metoxy-1,4-benzoquinol methylase
MSDQELFCPSCGITTNWISLLKAKDKTNELYKCEICGLRRLYPIPRNDVLQGLYEDLTHAFNQEKASMARRSVDYYIRLLKRYRLNDPSEWKLLDIGAGLGYYSEAFGKREICVTYNDADQISSNFVLKTHSHIKEFQCLEAEKFLSESKNQFDIVFCRHFIEHTLEPDIFLKLVFDKLKPGGIMILETDNNASRELLDHPEVVKYWGNFYFENYEIDSITKLKKIQVTALGKKNTHWWAFDQKNLEMLLNRSGYKTLFFTDYHLGDRFLWPNIPSYLQKNDWEKEYIKKMRCDIVKYLISRPFNVGAGILFIVTKDK